MKKRITAVLMAVLMGAVCMAGCEDKQKAGEPVPLPDKKEVPELENTDQENTDQEETKQEG